MIVLIGTELTYAIAKERRHIPPQGEMPVVAPPGEQPTPKFAPQVGAGSGPGEDGKEAAGVAAMGPPINSPDQSHGPGQQGNRPLKPRSGTVKKLLSMGLMAGTAALAGLVARRVHSSVRR